MATNTSNAASMATNTSNAARMATNTSNAASMATNTSNATRMATNTSNAASMATNTLSAVNTAVITTSAFTNTSSAASVPLSTSSVPRASVLQSLTQPPSSGCMLCSGDPTKCKCGLNSNDQCSYCNNTPLSCTCPTYKIFHNGYIEEIPYRCIPTLYQRIATKSLKTRSIRKARRERMKPDAFKAQRSHNLSTVAQQNTLGSTSGTQDAATPQTSTSGCSLQSYCSSSGVATSTTQSTTTPTTTNTNTNVQDSSSSPQNTLGTTQGISTQQTSSSGSSRQNISRFLESITNPSATSTEMVAPNTECKAPYQKATKAVVTSGVIPPQSCPERNPSVNNVLESFMEECTATSSLPSSQLTPKPKSHGRKRRAKNTPNNNNIVRRSPRIAAKKARTEI